jgi:hypothetical protein
VKTGQWENLDEDLKKQCDTEREYREGPAEGQFPVKRRSTVGKMDAIVASSVSFNGKILRNASDKSDTNFYLGRL